MNRRRLVSLADALEETNERASDSGVDLVLSVTEKRGIIPQSAVFNKRIAVADLSKYKVLEPLDIAFNPYLVWAGAYSQWVGTQRGVVSPVYETFRVREGVDPRFVGILLSSGLLTPYFDATAVGSVPRRRRTTVPVFLSAQIGLPEFGQQQRIVDLVGSVDGYIDSLQTQVEATRVARSALLAELLSIPGDDWRDSTLGEVAEVVSGGTPPTSNPAFWSGDIVWVTPTEIVANNGKTIFSSLRTITEAGLSSSSAKLLPVDTVLLTSRATIGAVALAGVPLATNQGFASLICREDVLPKFVMYWCQANKPALVARAGGNTFLEISRKRVTEIPIYVPPLAEQRRIVDLIESIDEQAASLESLIASAQILRGGVLSDLLSGERLLDESYDVAVSL